MATYAPEKKTGRIDLRMTDEQRHQIDLAAAVNGMSVSQWCLGKLMESARRDIAEQGLMRLSSEAFDSFARLLEQDANPRFAELKNEATRWEK